MPRVGVCGCGRAITCGSVVGVHQTMLVVSTLRVSHWVAVAVAVGQCATTGRPGVLCTGVTGVSVRCCGPCVVWCNVLVCRAEMACVRVTLGLCVC